MRSLWLGLAALLLSTNAALADAPVEGRAGRAEVRFLEGMIDHHQMALDMANDCLAHATTDSVLAICQNVISAQTPEIEQMQSWLRDWYDIEYAPVAMVEPDAMAGMAGMDHSMHSSGPFTDPPMTMGMMAGLNRLQGVDYDIAWLEAMIDHHDDAVHMAQRVLMRAQHPPLIALAETIISDQSAEIEQMEALLTATGA